MVTHLLYILLHIEADEALEMAGAGLLVLILLYVWANRPTVMLSHWHHSFSDIEYSPEEIYKATERSIKAKEIPGVSFERVTHLQEGVLDKRREYLRIKKDNYTIDMCAAPFAKGFYVSWRLLEKKKFWREFVRKFPMFVNLADLKTYYQVDTEIMIKDYMHKGILEAIDEMTKSKGLRALSDTERMLQPLNK